MANARVAGKIHYRTEMRTTVRYALGIHRLYCNQMICNLNYSTCSNNSLYVKIIFIVCVHVNIVARKCYTNKIPLDRLLVIAYMSHAGQNSPSETLNISVCGAVKICQKASLKYHVSVTERVKIIQVLLDGNKYLFYFTPCNSLHISQHV